MRLRNSLELLIIIILLLVATGCSSVKKVETSPFYEKELINLDELCFENRRNSFEVKAFVKGRDCVYVLLEVWGDNEQEQIIYRIKNGEVLRLMSCEIEEDTATKTMDIDSSGDFYILEEKRESEKIYPGIKIVEHDTYSVRDFSLEEYIEENDQVKSLQLGTDACYLFLESGKILTISNSFEVLGDIKECAGAYFVDSIHNYDGKVFCVYANYTSENEILKLYEVDKTSIKEMIDLPQGNYDDNILISGNEDYEFFVKSDYELLGEKKGSSELTPVFRYQDVNIQSSELLFLCAVENGSFLAIKESEKTDLTYIIKGRKQGEEKKELLYLASLDEDSSIDKEVAEFNKTNKEYRIEIKRYGDREEPIQSFFVDVSSGMKYDMVEFPVSATNKLITKGVFTDLYPFIDSDATLTKDDFYENILNAFECDGKLYHSVSFIHMYGWVTKQEQLNCIGDWDVKSIREYMEQNPNTNIYTDMSNESILRQMLLVSSEELMDWEQKKCYFDSVDFENILKLAKDCGNDNSKIKDADKVAALVDDKLLFIETPVSIEDFCVYYKVLGEDMKIVSSPYTKDFGVNLYSSAPQIGIVENSKHYDGAWQFVRRFFTREYQDISGDEGFQLTGYLGFPIRKDCVDDLIKRFTATEDYEKDGKWYTALKPDGYSIGWDEFDINIGPMDKNEELLLRKMLSVANQKQEIDPVIWDIVLEESRLFFSGEKSSEETAQVIQRRVTVYMNE